MPDVAFRSLRSRAGNMAKTIAALATATLATMLVIGGVGDASAQATFPTCSSNMYLSQYGGGWTGTRLFRVETGTNPFTYPVLGTDSPSYNATGYNPLDNLLYAMRANDGSSNHLVQIDSGGNVVDLGQVTDMPNLASISFAGEIGPDGTYYVFQEGQLFRINIAAQEVVGSATLSSGISPPDLAWYNGDLYGVSGGDLYRIDPTSGAVDYIGATGIGGSVGATFGTPTAIYGAANAGNFYRFDLTTGEATLISNAPPASGNDGAKCVNSELEFPADLQITKTSASATFPPGGEVEYTIEVSNAGPFGAQGAVTSDPLPTGITEAEWECVESGGGTCPVAEGENANGNAIDNINVNLPVGTSVTFNLTLQVPAEFTEDDLTNVATVSGPDDSPDPTPGNNEDTETDVADPVLTLAKDLTNDNGGDATTADFTLTATGPDTISGAHESDAVTEAAVTAGTYALSETNLPGYTAGDYSCVVNGAAAVSGNSISLVNGDRAVCTIANDDQPATLTLQKTVTNDDGGTADAADFTLTATGGLETISGVTGDSAVTNASVPAGSYTLSESGPDGYTASYSCVVNGGAAQPGSSLALANGDDAVCTIENDDNAAELTLLKTVTNNDGGSAVVGDFVLTATGPTTISGATGDPAVTDASVSAGNYTLSETGPAGYAADYQCAVNGGTAVAGDSLTLANGDDAVCTIANDDQAATLTLRKTVVNNDGGTASAEDFTLTATGPANLSGPSGDSAVTGVAVPAGTYTLGEDALAGYSAGTYRCAINGGTNVSADSVTLANGDDALCTITNDDIPPDVSIRKDLVAESGSLDGAPEEGETLTYEITLTNAGGTARDYDLVDELDSKVTFVSASGGGVPVGGEVRWSNLTVPTQDGGTPGELVLQVQVLVGALEPGDQVANLAKDPDEPDPLCPSAQCVVIPPPPFVEVEKDLVAEDGSLDGVAEAGEQLTYQITLSNVGSPTATYALRDELDDNTIFVSATNGGTHDGAATGGIIDWSGLSVPGASGGTPGTATLQVVVQVVDPLPDGAARLTNIAYDPGGPPPTCPAPECATVPAEGKVAIDKALTGESGARPGEAEPGEDLTYTITLTNTGGRADNFSVVDVLDPDTTLVGATPPGSLSGDIYTWSGLSVPAHDGTNPGTLTLTITVTVDDPQPVGKVELSNLAREPGDPDPPCPSDQCVTTPAAPDIAISKALIGQTGGDDNVAEPGERLTYEITLSNDGGAASDFAVDDRLDPNVEYVDSSDGGQLDGDSVSWTGLSVPAYSGGSPGQRVLTVVVDVPDPIPGGVARFSNIAKEPGDPDPACPSGQCVEIPSAPSVSIEKDLVAEDGSQSGVAEAGETLTYEITLTNDGGADATNYEVRDELDPNTVFAFADNGGTSDGTNVDWSGLTVPASGTLVLTVRVQVDDPIDGGVTQLSNLAREPGGPVPPCPSDQCVTTPVEGQISPTKELVAQSGDDDGVAEAGEQLTYEITLTNTGGIQTGYTITDELDPNTDLVDANNGGTEAGGIVTWSGLTIPAHDGTSPGELVLRVVVAVHDPLSDGVTQLSNIVKEPGDPDPPCPSAQCVVMPSEPSIGIEKSLVSENGSKPGVVEDGERLTYAITLTNTGGAASNYAVQDRLDPNTNFVSADNGGDLNGLLVEWSGLSVPAAAGPGSPGTLTLTVVVDAHDTLDAGVTQVSNLAKEPGQPDPPCPSQQCVVTPADGSVTQAKRLVGEDGAQPGVVEDGERLTYEITLANTGGQADGYAVQDILDPNTNFVTADNGGAHSGGVVTWTGLTIPAYNGTSPGVLVLTVVVTAADPINAGVSQVSNLVKEPGGPDPACPSAQCVTTPTAASVMIGKALTAESGDTDDVAEPGEQLTYEITLTNTGGQADGYAVRDVLDPNTTFVSADNGGTSDGTNVDWNGLTVPAATGGGPGVLVLTVVVAVNDPLDSGVNQVSNLAKEPTAPDPDCPSVQCVVTPASPSIVIAKALTAEDGDTDGVAEAGERLTYQITLTNTGGATDQYDVQDVLDPNTSFVSADNGGVDNGDTVDWTNLTVPPATGPSAPGTLVLTVVVEVASSLDESVEQVANIAKAPGDPDPPCPSDQCAQTPAQMPEIDLEKTGAYEDTNGDGVSSVGDLIRYTFAVTNAGNVTLADTAPVDEGPTFNGVDGEGSLSEFTPPSASLEPGETVEFTATYALTQQDIDNAAGLSEAVENTAIAIGYANGGEATGTPVETEESSSVQQLPVAASDVSITKIALLRHIRRGEQVPYVIRVTNNSGSVISDLTVTDRMPSGFRFVEGSATIDDVSVEPVVAGRTVTFEDLTLQGGQTLEIGLRLLALSSAGPGEHKNEVSITDITGQPLAPIAEAVVEILAEPVFDCGDVIGKVFDDVNRNGYQDPGEPGLPGVRIATVKGWLITTDAHGRFHVACALLPDQRIGSNFIMKLDTRTLPTGYRVTTENPRVVRLTAGKTTKLNFGAAIGRVVRLDLKDEAFEPGSFELREQWADGVDRLVEVLGKERSVLRLSYTDATADEELAKERVERLRDRIAERWRRIGGGYRLEIETRLEVGR